MAMLSARLGSSIITLAKRRERAASFSMCFWYSSWVVAPTVLKVPRAKAGFKILAASRVESIPLPEPMMVWSSSIKRITLPSSSISLMILFIRSSKSPRKRVPATTFIKSSSKTRILAISAGTSPLAIRWASPRARAVFPTPASPTKTGLFLVFRLKIWIIREISLSRPITGSNLPERACSVRSCV